MMPALFTVVLALGVQTEPESVLVRTIDRSTREVPSEVQSFWRVAIDFQATEMSVRLLQDRACFVETVETRTDEKYRARPTTVFNTVAMGVLAVAGFAGAGAAAYLAPEQRSLDVALPGELSREVTYGIAAASGLVGLIGAAGAVAVAVNGEEVLGRETVQSVIGSRRTEPCEATSSTNFVVKLETWDGLRLEGRTASSSSDGVVSVVLDRAVLHVPPPAVHWAKLTAELNGVEQVAGADVDPPAERQLHLPIDDNYIAPSF